MKIFTVQKLLLLVTVWYFLGILYISYISPNLQLDPRKLPGMPYDLASKIGAVGLEFLNPCQCSVPFEVAISREHQERKFCWSVVHGAKVDINADSLLETVDLSYPQNKWVHNGWIQQFGITFEAPSSTEQILNVIVVPFSHADAGWKLRFDEYASLTTAILESTVAYMKENSDVTFLWGETSFLKQWYRRMPATLQQDFTSLLKSGRFEISDGGWIMPDQAVANYEAILEQLTYGHQWLDETFGHQVNCSWSLDAFGLSHTVPYLLNRSGISDFYAVRVHYAIKRHLIQQKQLDFYWQSKWETSGPGLLTHISPFVLYNIPYSCGPDYDACCQFDFYKKHCWSWGKDVGAENITDRNVHRKSRLLVEQWHKKSQLSGHKVVLHLHGDDFRYTTRTEWAQQIRNLTTLMAYINRTPALNTKVRFGHLRDYFSELRQLRNHTIPRLSGDMLVYSDRDDQYWAGCYTSRPHLKRVIRLLQSRVRAADILMTICVKVLQQGVGVGEAVRVLQTSHAELMVARETSNLLQHHDAITGTARSKVIDDYLDKAMEALTNLDRVFGMAFTVIIKSAQRRLTSFATAASHPLLVQSIEEKTILDAPYFRPLMMFVPEEKSIFTYYNPLPYERQEVMEILTNSPNVAVYNAAGLRVSCQVNPIVMHDFSQKREMFKVFFLADLSPLSLSMFTVERLSRFSKTGCPSATVTVYQQGHHHSYNFSAQFITYSKEMGDVTFGNDRVKVSLCKCSGLLLSVEVDGVVHRAQQQFAFYTTGKWYTPLGDRSGAYIFLPTGPAFTFQLPDPTVVVTEGPLVVRAVTTISSQLTQTVTVYRTDDMNPLARCVHLVTEVDIRELNNTEVALRLDTDVTTPGAPHMFVDVNGMYTARRTTLDRLPLQGNFHPFTSHVFVQNRHVRVTVLSRQSHGVATLEPGQLDIMLDRRLSQDDWRGLDEGVMDNTWFKAYFTLVVENREPINKAGEHPVESLSLTSHLLSLFMNHQPVGQLLNIDPRLQTDQREIMPVEDLTTFPQIKRISLLPSAWPCDTKLLSFKLTGASMPENHTSALITVHRVMIECDAFLGYRCTGEWLSAGLERHLANIRLTGIWEVGLTGVGPRRKVTSMKLEPTEIKTFQIDFTVVNS